MNTITILLAAFVGWGIIFTDNAAAYFLRGTNLVGAVMSLLILLLLCLATWRLYRDET